jgi:NAD-dependent deacetylase
MEAIDAVAGMVVAAKRLVVFSGAGVSTESGVSDFRSPGGVWDRFDPDELNYQTFMASETGRERYWQFQRELWPEMVKAQPNPGHHAITEFYNMGKLDCVITQNIDYLHQRAGVPEDRVIELHGTMKWVLCLECGRKYPREEIQARLDDGTRVPRCDSCGGIMKPATISFGQAMPERETQQAMAKAAACDLLLSVGSSLVVYPAAQMPLIAKNSGARLVIVNLTPTPHDRHADIVINAKTGPVLSAIAERVKAKLP